MEWNRHEPNCLIPNQRYGHTGVLYGKKFYVFGGRSKQQNYSYLSDLEVYNLDDKTWSTPLIVSKNILQLRRNHIAKVIGHQMFIHGGINENGEYLNDSFLFTFYPQRWNQCIITDPANAPYLTGHAACLVLPTEIKYNSKMNIYKLPELGYGKSSSKVNNI